MVPEYYWMGGMWMFPIIFIAVLVIVGYLLFTRCGGKTPFCGRGHDMYKPESALEILKKRYAKGEISKDEFEEMKNNIL